MKSLFDNVTKKAGSAAENDREVFFSGIVSRITFRNDETGFGVLRADADELRIAATPFMPKPRKRCRVSA